MYEETILYQPEAGTPRLIILSGGEILEYELDQEQTFGRPAGGKAPELAVKSGVVSRRHGQFLTNAAGSRYSDAGSLNGTIYNGRELEPGAGQLLSDGDVLRVHGRQDESSEMDVLMIYSTASGGQRREWSRISLGEAAEIVIGRNEKLRLQEKSVSRRHASLFRAKKGWALIDHGSRNGVFLNAVRVEEPVYLHKNDVIRIAGYYFVFLGDELLFQSDPVPEAAGGGTSSAENKACGAVPSENKAGGAMPSAENADGTMDEAGSEARQREAVSLAAEYRTAQAERQAEEPAEEPDSVGLSVWIEERNVWNRAKKKTLLRDIRLEIPAGSMVLILGGSGAGKTTFMNAVMGYERAEGEIRYAGTDIYREYERMKYEIGYVPQQDLLRMNDTVYDTLYNAANMRLPVMQKEEYAEHVEETLHLLGLERLRDSLVGKLSGGQRKRLSIAVEYIGNPSLFFLDEPDSGLDGTMARQLMENLREIADQGRIVLVISHSPDRAFELFDKVIVLAKSSKEEGRLVFYGSPEEACGFFEVSELEGIMTRINYPEEGGEGLADMYIRRFEEFSG
ncbi:MAG: ATP-binding cassette domain-containing protein [Eubacterium sp.]|nr:ATP-binding cassette domain-containing protein [Eubacterium sp.]